MSFIYLKGCSDHSLTRHNSRKDSNNQTRVERARWYRVEKRVRVGALVLADVCSLTDVLRIDQRPEDRNILKWSMAYC